VKKYLVKSSQKKNINNFKRPNLLDPIE
jgi:hypothetical protein